MNQFVQSVRVMEDIIIESADNQSSMVEYMAAICYEINKIKANYPSVDLNDYISKLELLIKHCDTLLLDREETTSKLDSSLKETAVLEYKLDTEKKIRASDLNQSFICRDEEHKEQLMLKSRIKELEAQLNSNIARNNLLLSENHEMQQEMRKAIMLNGTLTEKIKIRTRLCHQ